MAHALPVPASSVSLHSSFSSKSGISAKENNGRDSKTNRQKICDFEARRYGCKSLNAKDLRFIFFLVAAAHLLKATRSLAKHDSDNNQTKMALATTNMPFIFIVKNQTNRQIFLRYIRHSSISSWIDKRMEKLFFITPRRDTIRTVARKSVGGLTFVQGDWTFKNEQKLHWFLVFRTSIWRGMELRLGGLSLKTLSLGDGTGYN